MKKVTLRIHSLTSVFQCINDAIRKKEKCFKEFRANTFSINWDICTVQKKLYHMLFDSHFQLILISVDGRDKTFPEI